MNYYPRHVGDYLRDAAHLTLLEHGVYARLMDVYYVRESGIPEEDAHRLVCARIAEETEAVDRVLNEFFVLAEGIWTHKRCEAEIQAMRDKSTKAADAANARWSKDKPPVEPKKAKEEPKKPSTPAAKRTDSGRNAGAMPTHSGRNANQEPITKQPPNGGVMSPPLDLVEGGASDRTFADWWADFDAAYPKRNGGMNRPQAKEKAQRAWSAKAWDFEEVLAGCRRYRAWADGTGKTGTELVKQMTTWFNQQCWTDDWSLPEQGGQGQQAVAKSTAATRARLAEKLGVDL